MLDNAPEFVGKVLMVLCNLLNVKQVRMSPYHPQSNGSIECAHQTLIRMVGKLDHKRKSRWPDHISSICHTYNMTKSQVMGYSLHFLMFGRRPCLPIDLIFLMAHQEAVKGVDHYVLTLYEHLRCAISLACTAAHKEAQRFKWIYDKRANMIVLCPSNKVLTHLDTFMGTRRKLKNWWNSQLHMVVCHVVDGVPTYVVRNYNNRNESIFHRRRLLLWIAADTDGDDGVRSSPAITALGADGPVERDTMVECVVSQDVSYGLSLAVFKTMIGPSCHKTGCEARAPQSGVVPQAVGHVTSEQKREQPPMTGDTVEVEDVLPWGHLSGEALLICHTFGLATGRACSCADLPSCGYNPSNRDLLYVHDGGDAWHIMRTP